MERGRGGNKQNKHLATISQPDNIFEYIIFLWRLQRPQQNQQKQASQLWWNKLLDKNNLPPKQSLQYWTAWLGELAELNALPCANA